MHKKCLRRSNLIWIGTVLLLSVAIFSCEKIRPTTPEIIVPEEVVEIDPSDANSLSNALIIANATEINGPLPQPSDSETAPRIEGNVPEIISSNGSTFLLPFQYSATNSLAGYYIQIRGADSYYDLPYTGLAPDIVQVGVETVGAPAAPLIGAGSTLITVGLPQNVGVGFFETVYGVYDDQGQTSNFIDTVIEVVNVGTGILQISLSWNIVKDIDLWVTDPSGFRIFFGDKISAATGGELDRDDVDSFGPENIYWKEGAPPGTYKIEVNYYAGTGAADYIVTVNAPAIGANTEGYARQYTGTLYSVNETHLIVTLEKHPDGTITFSR